MTVVHLAAAAAILFILHFAAIGASPSSNNQVQHRKNVVYDICIVCDFVTLGAFSDHFQTCEDDVLFQACPTVHGWFRCPSESVCVSQSQVMNLKSQNQKNVTK